MGKIAGSFQANRQVDFEDLKDYAIKNKVFNSRDLRMNFAIKSDTANYYCKQLEENGVTVQIGKQSGMHGKPSFIYKSII